MTGSGVTIRNNLIYGVVAPFAKKSGRNIKVATGGEGGGASDLTIAHNILGESHSTTSIAFDPQDVARVGAGTIVNNVLYGNELNAMDVYNDPAVIGPVVVRNNVFAGNGWNCVTLELETCSALPSKYEGEGNLSFDDVADVGFLDLSTRNITRFRVRR